MRALTLTQPWATLVAIGAKRIETRSWSTAYRGPIAIHAAKKFPAEARCLCPLPPFSESLGAEILHTSQIIAVADLVQCFQFGPNSEARVRERSAAGLLPEYEADYGDYTPGRYGFVFANVRPLLFPVYCRGKLGLWTVPLLSLHQLTEQVAEAVNA